MNSSEPLDMTRWPLTARQRQTLRFISDYVRDHGYPPSQRDLVAGLGLSRQSTQCAFELVSRLQRKGMLTVVPRIARGLAITPAGRAVLAADPGP